MINFWNIDRKDKHEQCQIPHGSKFEDLKSFCKAIASIMPGTSSVQSEFSLIYWTKDPSSQNLTDSSLESILHRKQYQKFMTYLNKIIGYLLAFISDPKIVWI